MIKVAIGQITPTTCDKQANTNKMVKYIRQAANEGAQLVVFPELVLTGYNCGNRFFDEAETIPGQATQYFSELAAALGIYIIWGMPEKSVEGVLYNAAALVGPEGFIGKWRKNTLPGHASDTSGPGAFPDRKYFKPGEHAPIYETAIGKIGLLICYDIWFPELARLLTLKGADLIVGISGSPLPERDIFEPIVKARAAENAINFIYTNLVGTEGNTTYWGGGFIVSAGDPERNVPGSPILCKAPYVGESLTFAELDPDAARKIRPAFPVIRDLTTHMYEELAAVHRSLT